VRAGRGPRGGGRGGVARPPRAPVADPAAAAAAPRSNILDDIHADMDSTHGRLRLARKKIEEVMRKTSGRAQCYIMGGLVATLAVLMILAFA